MIKSIRYLIMGIIIGIAKIIPGVSGAVIAISFGVYDLGIHAITHFFDDVKKHFIFLINIGIGVLIGIIVFSNIINYMINNYYLIVMLFFSGLVLGGIPSIGRKIKKDKLSYIIITLSFILIFLLGISNVNNIYVNNNSFIDYLIYFMTGVMEALGTVVPGVSSTALLMIMGTYNIFIEFIANVTNISYISSNFIFIIMFGLGLILGIIIISLLIDYLFKIYRERIFAFIMGISLGSVMLIILKSFIYSFIITDLIIGIILLIGGFIVAYFFDS